MQNKKTILVITGPTAVGKTDFAINCAKKFNGEIISCDSMQIFKDLNIGTAKATKKEQSIVNHYLINIINPNQEFSVQEYVTMAREKIDEITSKNKLPIIVGGTGLYIKSLIFPYSFCSSHKDESIRIKYQKILEDNGKEFLYQLLKEKDEEATKKIHQNDTKRVIRALEICDLSHNKKTTLNQQDSLEAIYNVIFIVLNLDRQKLYEKINLRVEKMFGMGLLKEFMASIKKYNLTPKSQSMQAIGYRELFDLIPKNLDNVLSQNFNQEVDLNLNIKDLISQNISIEVIKNCMNENFINTAEIKEIIKKDTRNYAKRQITFFKGFKDLATWFDSNVELENAVEFISKKLKIYTN